MRVNQVRRKSWELRTIGAGALEFPAARAGHETRRLESLHGEFHHRRRRIEWCEAEAQVLAARELPHEGHAVGREELLSAFRGQPLLRRLLATVPLQANGPVVGVFFEAGRRADDHIGLRRA